MTYLEGTLEVEAQTRGGRVSNAVAPDINAQVTQTIAGAAYDTDLGTTATVVRGISCHDPFTDYTRRKGEQRVAV